MLKSLSPDGNLNRTIKVLSTGLITAALGLELGNITAHFFGIDPFANVAIAFWIGRSALVIHAVEGAIAAAYAPSRQRSALRYGIYTFFVGTVGLVELWQLPQLADDSTQ
ncbi:MAG: hypothetical protein AAGD09_12530 [Cyanobacteria bacterium P01_F01_bin.56]